MAVSLLHLARCSVRMVTASENKSQDVQYATLLSELVYRAAECSSAESFQAAKAKVEAEMGARLQGIQHHKSGGQRYLVGESDTTIYVAFQGTKHATDWVANLNFFHVPFWHHKQTAQDSSSTTEADTASNNESDSFSDSSSTSSSRRRTRWHSSHSMSRAHVGFVNRVNQSATSVSALYESAAAAGKRLVLTGHSLGGAVATLTTVKLLRSLAYSRRNSPDGSNSSDGGASPAWQQVPLMDPCIRCISFATPAIANADLLQEVTAAGWDRFITNIVLPEDPVVPFVNTLLKAPAVADSLQSGLYEQADLLSPGDMFSSQAAANFDKSDSAYSSLSLGNTSSDDWSSSADACHRSLGMDSAEVLAAAAAAATAWPLDLSFQDTSGLAITLQTLPCSPCSGRDSSSSSSAELASWLSAAQAAVVQQRQGWSPTCSFASTATRSSSAASLSSLPLAALSSTAETCSNWGNASSSLSRTSSNNSIAAFATRLETSLAAATAAASQWWAGCGAGSSSGAAAAEVSSKLGAAGSPMQQIGFTSCVHAGSHPLPAAAAAAAASILQSGMQHAAAEPPACTCRAKHGRNSSRKFDRFRLSRAGMALLAGALAAGVRCAGAFASSTQLAGPHLTLLGLLPGVLTAPAALAALHVVSNAALKAALPVSHPLGQQLVMTGSGLEVAMKPLNSYPRNPDALNLQSLGGLFPGHRMIAYRRRLVGLMNEDKF